VKKFCKELRNFWTSVASKNSGGKETLLFQQWHVFRTNYPLTVTVLGLECRSSDELRYRQHQIDAEARPVAAQGSHLRPGDHRLNIPTKIYNPSPKNGGGFFVCPPTV